MRNLLAVLVVLAALAPGALASADGFNADLFVQYTYLDAKGSDDPAYTLNLIGSHEIKDWFSVWASATLTTLSTGGGTTNTTGFGAGIGLYAEYTERLSSLVLAGYIRSIIDADDPGSHGSGDDYMIQPRLTVSVNPVMDLSFGGSIFLGADGASEQWGGAVEFNVTERFVMGYEVMLGDVGDYAGVYRIRDGSGFLQECMNMTISEPAGLTRRQCLGRAAQALRPPDWRLRPRPTTGRSCSAWRSTSPPLNYSGTTTSAFPRACRLSTSNDVGTDRVVDAVATGIDLRVLSALTPGARNLTGPEGVA